MNFMKALASIILMTLVVFVVGCKPEEEPNKWYTIEVSVNPSTGGTVNGGGSYLQGQNVQFHATSNDGYVFYYWSEDNEWVSSDATYSFTVDRDRRLVAHFAMISGDGHAYIDLGLPSGTLWATCNVGANTPEEYGDYFAWGETSPKEVYDCDTYQYCNGSNNNLTKYCTDAYYGYNGFADYLTTLLPEDDAAAANWGNGWCIPTYYQWEELSGYTTCVRTTYNGARGMLFTGLNDNSLFLPAAGFGGHGPGGDAGVAGNYCSSSLSYPPTVAHSFVFDSDNCSFMNYSNCWSRYVGLSVRPVRSSRQN